MHKNGYRIVMLASLWLGLQFVPGEAAAAQYVCVRAETSGGGTSSNQLICYWEWDLEDVVGKDDDFGNWGGGSGGSSDPTAGDIYVVSDEWADAPYVDQNCQTDVNIRHEHAIEAIHVHLSTLQTSTFVGRTWVTYFRSSQGVRTGYERWRVDSVRIANGYLYPDRLSRLACTMQ